MCDYFFHGHAPPFIIQKFAIYNSNDLAPLNDIQPLTDLKTLARDLQFSDGYKLKNYAELWVHRHWTMNM